MIRMSLSAEEQSALNRLRLTKNTNVGERAHYVLLSGAGKSVKEIATQISRNEHTIRLWLNRYRTEGISGLKTHQKSGRPAKKAVIIESQLEALLHKSPQDYGYQEAGWQISVLRHWFEKKGLSACDNTLAKALNKLGFVYKRFSKTLPANAPSADDKKARINAIVDEIGKYSTKNIEVLFVDESHFSNQPYVSRGWFKYGEKK